MAEVSGEAHHVARCAVHQLNTADCSRNHTHRCHAAVKTMVAPLIAAMDLAGVGTDPVNCAPPTIRCLCTPVGLFVG